MEMHQLEYLIAIAEEGSFTRAAERLHIAQPSRDLCIAWSLRRYRTNAARALAETVRSLLALPPRQ